MRPTILFRLDFIICTEDGHIGEAVLPHEIASRLKLMHKVRGTRNVMHNCNVLILMLHYETSVNSPFLLRVCKLLVNEKRMPEISEAIQTGSHISGYMPYRTPWTLVLEAASFQTVILYQ